MPSNTRLMDKKTRLKMYGMREFFNDRIKFETKQQCNNNNQLLGMVNVENGKLPLRLLPEAALTS